MPRLLLILILSAAFTVRAQEAVRFDSSEVAVRALEAGALEAYRSNPAFVYDEAQEPVTWWDRFKRWVRETFIEPLFSDELSPVRRFVFYAILAAVLLFAVSRLLRVEWRGLFYGKGAAPALTFEEVEDNLAETDFDRLIAEAVAARNYRRAVRLSYLKALKELAARDLIAWQRDKTNHEYLGELRRPELRPAFAALTYQFEYAWYGDFPVDERVFARVQQTVRDLEGLLAQGPPARARGASVS